MKKSLFAVITFTLALAYSCTKNTDVQQGYYEITVYKNTLSLPIYMQAVYSPEDMQAPKQLINPGDSIKYTGYVCLKNCPQPDLAASLMVAVPIATRIYIGEKVKTDYNCNQVPDATAKAECQKDAISLYNQQRWIESRKRDTVVKTYNIDKADSLEAK